MSVPRLDDPDFVRREYASERRLAARAAAYEHEEPGIPVAPDVALDAVADVAPRQFLEVGCGWGWFAERVATRIGCDVVAVDLSPRMVELARERGIDARIADVQDLPFGDGEFDCVAALWMLYHVPDLDRGLREIRRVLRAGGRLVAITNSDRHLIELRTLVGGGPSAATFRRENGGAILSRHFARVRRRDVDGTVVFADADAVREYVTASITLSHLAANVPPLDEPVRARRAVSVFVADA